MTTTASINPVDDSAVRAQQSDSASSQKIAPLVSVQGLCVDVRMPTGGTQRIVHDVSFSISRGEVLALIGESGSGKTTIGLATMGHFRPGCYAASGVIRLGDVSVLNTDSAGLRKLWGRRVAYVAQSAAASFNPAHRLLKQVIEPAMIHGTMTHAQACARARELFAELALPDPENIGDRYPHEVSGGQLQRMSAAMALVCGPELVVFDEPTTALDVTTQIEVLRSFKAVIKKEGIAAIYITHDLALVAQIAHRIVVMKTGCVQESGTAEQIVEAPAHAYTQSLIAALRPRPMRGDAAASEAGRSGATMSNVSSLSSLSTVSSTIRSQSIVAATAPALEARNITVTYPGSARTRGQPITVLHDVSIALAPGAVVGVIGESGSGKSTLLRVLAGLVHAHQGEVLLDGKVLAAQARQRSKADLRRVQSVFQMADVALNPTQTVGNILARPFEFYDGTRGDAAKQRVRELLDMVRLPVDFMSRRPGELSGGQKQRVNLARALAANPDVILCDEVTSALDAVVGKAIVDLLSELRRELGLAILFVSHDISTVTAFADNITVLKSGHAVEQSTTIELLKPPHHAYTELLLNSIPEMRVGWLEDINVH